MWCKNSTLYLCLEWEQKGQLAASLTGSGRNDSHACDAAKVKNTITFGYLGNSHFTHTTLCYSLLFRRDERQGTKEVRNHGLPWLIITFVIMRSLFWVHLGLMNDCKCTVIDVSRSLVSFGNIHWQDMRKCGNFPLRRHTISLASY